MDGIAQHITEQNICISWVHNKKEGDQEEALCNLHPSSSGLTLDCLRISDQKGSDKTTRLTIDEK